MDLQDFLSEWNDGSDTVTVQTSGSTGMPKKMHVEKRRMEASARITCDFLGLKPGDTALLCMPLDYIAGKMVVVRSIVRGLRLISVKPSSRPLASLAVAPTFAAMTPMQVYGCMQTDRERELLTNVRQLIIGGGGIDKDLEAQLHGYPNAIWSTYGMTETLSHIALRRINGAEADKWYTPFDGVHVDIGADGCLVINAPEVCPNILYTNDIAELAPDGRRFRILGRKDNVIDSGGIKIRIEEVESALHGHLSVPFIITKKQDHRFGEAVVLLFEGGSKDVAEIRRICENILPRYWRPKFYCAVVTIPVTETGKPARAEAERLAETALE